MSAVMHAGCTFKAACGSYTEVRGGGGGGDVSLLGPKLNGLLLRIESTNSYRPQNGGYILPLT